MRYEMNWLESKRKQIPKITAKFHMPYYDERKNRPSNDWLEAEVKKIGNQWHWNLKSKWNGDTSGVSPNAAAAAAAVEAIVSRIYQEATYDLEQRRAELRNKVSPIPRTTHPNADEPRLSNARPSLNQANEQAHREIAEFIATRNTPKQTQ